MIKEADELIKEFNAQSKGIKILAAKIKNQFRRCPDIVFFKDDSR